MKRQYSLSDKLLAYFSSFSREEGLDCFHKGQVAEVVVTMDKTGGQEVYGRVADMQIYVAKVYLLQHGMGIRNTKCSCSAAGDCKHTAALTMAFIDRINTGSLKFDLNNFQDQPKIRGGTSSAGSSSSGGSTANPTRTNGLQTSRVNAATPANRGPNRTVRKTRTVPLSVQHMEFTFKEQYGREGANSAGWWFSLELNIEVLGKKVAFLPMLLSAVRQLSNTQQHGSLSFSSLNQDGKFVARLQNDVVVTLPFEQVNTMLLALQELLQQCDAGDETKIDVSALHVAELLNDNVFAEARWIGAERVLSQVEKLRSLSTLEEWQQPKHLNAELRSYQRDGARWLQAIAHQRLGGILADDMGLGKTLQLITHICLEKENGRLTKPFLVVCPTSVLPNWASECAKFAPHLRLVAYSGSDRDSLTELLTTSDVVVTTYALLTRDIESLCTIEWQGLALDEAQAIKNPTTQIALSVRKLKASYRFCLSGTPIENHLGELWSQFHFLLPGLLGDQQTFTKQIRNPIEKLGDSGLKNALSNRVRPFMMRRTKAQVAQELPEKTIIVEQIELTAHQKALYESVRVAATQKIREEVAQKGFKRSQITVLDALLKLRQVCCDERLAKRNGSMKGKVRQQLLQQGKDQQEQDQDQDQDQPARSAKLERLIEMLQELTAEGRKVLVFSQFTSMLDLIAPRLTQEGLPFVQLRGDTRDRKTPVEQFQNGDVPIFLISLKAGGTGINLMSADVVIHFDPWWNPAVEDQATDRAHRIGQTKKVFVYKLIATGTIEQLMIELQDRKRLIAESIYDENGALTPTFSETDLDALLQPIR